MAKPSRDHSTSLENSHGAIPRVSILLIREAAEQMTGSGCCGRLEGDSDLIGGKKAFAEVRRQQEAFGILHRAVIEFFGEQQQRGELSIVTIDPRNQLYLIPKLFQDVWRYRPGWRSGLCALCQWFSLPAVIVNGRVLSARGVPLDPDTLCHEVGRLLVEDIAQSSPHASSSSPAS